ncbi:MAG: AMP phosphorylase [Nanoarchaeota archaeon]
MMFKVHDMDISTGGPLVVNINALDAAELDLHFGDRISIKCRNKTAVAVVNISTGDSIPRGVIGLFDEVVQKLCVRNGAIVRCQLEERPKSLSYIHEKLFGHTLGKDKLQAIIADIVANRLSDIEITYFVAACHLRRMTTHETHDLTRAMIDTGEVLKLRRRIIADKHCIGGVAGNRTTMLIVPICSALGVTMPKTSSRSITSPAGTADTMEVLARVDFSLAEMRRIVEKIDACIVWGGAINLAPADDRIIRVEHPLAIDSRSQLLASIMAKKASVSATHLIVDIPIDPFGKVSSPAYAKVLKVDFVNLGRELGIKTEVMITDGSHPIGLGLGPQLEARDVLWVLEGDDRGPADLRQKSIRLSGALLELTGKAKRGQGQQLAEKVLSSGRALDQMLMIIKEQHGNKPLAEKVHHARYSLEIRAKRDGMVRHINNSILSKLTRIAGSPADKGAGIYLDVKIGDRVKKGGILYTVFANNQTRLGYVENVIRAVDGVKVS